MNYKKNYVEKLDLIPAEKVLPIVPVPSFRTNTVHIKVIQGGFMDDQNRWHTAPKKTKEAVRINGWWYWVTGIRNKEGNVVISKRLIPCL